MRQFVGSRGGLLFLQELRWDSGATRVSTVCVMVPLDLVLVGTPTEQDPPAIDLRRKVDEPDLEAHVLERAADPLKLDEEILDLLRVSFELFQA